MVRSRGREQVRLKTTDDAKARTILDALDWVEDVASAGDGSLLAAAPVARSGELTAALSRAEVYVTEMAPVQTTLEEYFLEVTARKQARNDGPRPASHDR